MNNITLVQSIIMIFRVNYGSTQLFWKIIFLSANPTKRKEEFVMENRWKIIANVKKALNSQWLIVWYLWKMNLSFFEIYIWIFIYSIDFLCSVSIICCCMTAWLSTHFLPSFYCWFFKWFLLVVFFFFLLFLLFLLLVWCLMKTLIFRRLSNLWVLFLSVYWNQLKHKQQVVVRGRTFNVMDEILMNMIPLQLNFFLDSYLF